MSSSRDDSHLPNDPAPRLSKKYRDLTLTEKFQVRYAIPPPPDKRLLQNASLKVKCGDYDWNVHDEVLWTESGYVKQNLKENFVDLSEFQPELVARMILFCYYDKYPLSPNFEVAPASKTVSQILCENVTGNSSSSVELAEPKFDAVLHLNMYMLGLKLEMKYLTAYAQKTFKKSLAVEGEGFWPCVEMLNGMEEEVADVVDRRIRHAIDNKVWSTRRPFKELEKLRPTMAAGISDLGKRRFGTP